MVTAMIKIKKAKAIKLINTGSIKRIHRSIGTRHILNIAISPPNVGLMRLDNPSPI